MYYITENQFDILKKNCTRRPDVLREIENQIDNDIILNCLIDEVKFLKACGYEPTEKTIDLLKKLEIKI